MGPSPWGRVWCLMHRPDGGGGDTGHGVTAPWLLPGAVPLQPGTQSSGHVSLHMQDAPDGESGGRIC